MTQIPQRLTLPNTIADKLHSVRKRSFKVRLITAVVASVVVLLAAMGLAMLVDYLAVLYDSGWRTVLTSTALVAAGATLVAWIVAGWQYTRRLQSSAQEVDRSIPELEERWTTVANLSSSPEASRDVHPAMYRQVATEANRWTSRVESEQVVKYGGIVRALVSLTAVTAVLVIAMMINPRQTTVLMRRFWAPQAYISATEINHLPQGDVIGRGESLDLVAQLDGVPVKSAMLMLEPQEGEAKQLTLVPHVGDEQVRITHRIRSVKSPLKYRFRAGDGQTPWYEIAVADRPTIAATKLTVTPPAYTRQDRKQMVRLPRRLTVLEGSTVEIAIKPEFELKTAHLMLGNDGKIALKPDQDGWYRWQQEVNASFSFSPLLTEAHGLTNRKPPKCRVICQPDRPPVVKVLTPQNEVAVRPDDALEVTFVAKDDVGISDAQLVVLDESTGGRSKPKALKVINVDLGEQQGEKNIKATVRLDLEEFDLPDGAQLSYVVRVREDRGQSMPSTVSEASNNTVSGVTTLAEQTTPTGDPAANEDSTAETESEETVAANSTAAVESNQDQPEQKFSSTVAASDPVASPAGEQSTAASERQKMQTAASNTGSTANPPSSAETSSEPSNSETARTASSGQQQVRTGDQPQEDSTNNLAENSSAPQNSTDAPTSDASDQPDSSDKAEQMADNSSEQNSKSSAEPNPNQTASNQASPSAPAQNSSDDPQDQSSQPSGNQPPPDNFAKSTVDIAPARSASSQQMRVKVDQWAGSFEGQQRRKLELVVAPLMNELDENLEKAQALSRLVLDEIDEGDNPWRAKHNRDVSQAEKRVMAAIQAIEDLENQTNGTPYAFIGLQLLDISRAHVEPARRDFWKSLQSDSNQAETVRNGWQHTRRARELLTMLTERFERAKREYAMAESVTEIKKMHRIFIEESMGLLQPQGEGENGGGYSRKGVEFDLDQAYLDRLKEVLEMRNRMRRELARILREDPRLLRRYLDAQKNRQNNLRNDLYDIVEVQRELNREVSAWSKVEDKRRDELSSILLGRHVESVQDVSLAAAELLDRFQTWSPLDSTKQDKEIEDAAALMQTIATTAGELNASSDRYVAAEMPSSSDVEVDPNSAAVVAEDKDAILDQLDADAETLYDQLGQMEVQLRQLGLRSDRLDMANFATNRLVDTRKLIEQSSAWVRQLRQQRQGNYHRAAEVAQYRLAHDTETLVAKLADVESTLVGLMQRADGKLPPQVAASSREMFTEFDENAIPNQQAAIYALRRNKMTRAAERQDAALTALEAASEKYDEMIKRAIEELDKLPVQDPIAGLLDDPTLDELLGQLEQELPIEDLLGIPPRSSNLRIVTDFLQPAGDNGVITGQYSTQLMNQMREQQRLRRRQLDRAYRNAMSRALKESSAEDLVDDAELQLAGEHSDWNVLLSQLGDDLRQGRDKAPPERYRRAIEQYFRQISSESKDKE